jgi:hypothetical protein
MSIMATHQFQPTHYFTAIGQYPPVLRIAPGDTVITTTVDAAGGDQHGTRITAGGNPQTGPFFVEGAEPGDMLAVHLDRLSPSRSTGLTRTVLSRQVFDPPGARAQLQEIIADWDLDLTQGIGTIRPSAAITSPLTVPLAPMLGCFGVAPTWGQIVSGTALLIRRRRWPRQFFASGGRAMATEQTRGAFRFGLRLMAIDGTLDEVANTEANAFYFRRMTSGKSQSPFPQVRCMYLAEMGTHAIVDAVFAPCRVAEQQLIPVVLARGPTRYARLDGSRCRLGSCVKYVGPSAAGPCSGASEGRSLHPGRAGSD